jgi:hypothetical protein
MAIAGSNSKVASDVFAERAQLERQLGGLRKEHAQIELQLTELDDLIRVRNEHSAEMRRINVLSNISERGSELPDYDRITNERIKERNERQIQKASLNKRIKSLEVGISRLTISGSTTPQTGTPAKPKDPGLSNPHEPPLEKTKIVKRPTPDHDQVRINYPLPPEILAGRKR